MKTFAYCNSCCIKVGLEAERAQVRVGYTVSMGPWLLTGAFFGPHSVIEHMKEYADQLTVPQQNDTIRVLRDLRFL